MGHPGSPPGGQGRVVGNKKEGGRFLLAPLYVIPCMSFLRKRESSYFFLGSCLRRKDRLAPSPGLGFALAGLSRQGRGGLLPPTRPP